VPRRHSRDREINADVIIIGASLAGLATAEALRTHDFKGSIRLVGDERYHPYDRPPLSKGLLASPLVPSFDSVELQRREWFAERRVELVLATAAVGLDPVQRTVTLSTGATLTAVDLVIATGSQARRLTGVSDDLEDIYTLRNWDDFVRFAARLRTPGHLVVVGGGFIGLEAIAGAVSHGWRVTVLERDAAVLKRVLAPVLGELCWRPFRTMPVELRVDTSVSGVSVVDQDVRVHLDDGDAVRCDAVLLAAGGVPNTTWLENSGVELDDGVVCDGYGRTSAEHVWAVGDVASWCNAWTGRRARIEQWQAAREQAAICAAGILGQHDVPWSRVPYFWSDLPAGRVQFSGESDPADGVHLFESGTRTLAILERNGAVRGVLTLSLNPWTRSGVR
jgi:3-phenylpropionate/trans-cinnamate dioxygenase ferredoxin reductase subunit